MRFDNLQLPRSATRQARRAARADSPSGRRRQRRDRRQVRRSGRAGRRGERAQAFAEMTPQEHSANLMKSATHTFKHGGMVTAKPL